MTTIRWNSPPRPPPSRASTPSNPYPRRFAIACWSRSRLRRHAWALTEASSRGRRVSLAAWSGWLAAAACLTLALIIASRLAPQTSSPLDARQAFLQNAPDVQTAAWSDWDTPEHPGVRGEVAWSESEQKGYMTFDGLQPNDPAKEQYQLWIIDERGLEQRISGAIFNCADPDHVVVEIEPAVRIHGAAAFAITIERPGGVWVSDMTRRVVIASLKG
ncbi:MAG: anti-sigma factor [Phycisphaerales bacterium]|nr:anti-sigma factor [Phycisphaerales bacterium]